MKQRVLILTGVVLVALVVVLVLTRGRAPTQRVTNVVSISDAPMGQPIPAGFVGLSLEYTTLESYAGTDPQALNPVFEQLVRNLTPGQRPVLRIGGVSTDHSWYPVPGMAHPLWARYTLTPAWLAVTHALATALDARLILGLNFEADNPQVAAAEAGALINGIGRGSIEALELGNEPELYHGFAWYRTPTGAGVRGRPKGWNAAAFTQQFAALAHALPAIPLAGPAIGSRSWLSALPAFLAANRSVSLATVHAYPLKRCRATTHVTASELLAESSSRGLAGMVAPYARAARRAGDPLRIAEINSISCGGEPGLSNSFASALWSLDAMFSLARAGIAGVNIHTTPNVSNQLFSFQQVGGRWVARVYPVYYGLLLFARAAPAGSRLLQSSGATTGGIRTWATRAPDGRIRVVLINTRSSGPAVVGVRLPRRAAKATLERLTAPSLSSDAGVNLDGQSFGSATTSGVPAGAPRAGAADPQGDEYRVRLPAASAAMLTVSPLSGG